MRHLFAVGEASANEIAASIIEEAMAAEMAVTLFFMSAAGV
jgi:hypothetical protein